MAESRTETVAPSMLARPATSLDIREQRIVAYGGTSIRTLVATPTDRNQVRATFQYAKTHRLQVTFRGGGHAFDTQALNNQLVISFEKLRRIDVDEREGTVKAEAGARWGNILARTRAHGLVPHIMVTTSTATAGGTVSSNSLSRFSPTLGREGQHIVGLTLMTPDGVEHPCSSTSEADLFRAVVAGLGYMGAILDVTYRLIRLPYPPKDIAVHTVFDLVTGPKEIALKLISHLRQKARAASAAASVLAPAGAWAVSAVVYEQARMKGLIATSHYTSVPPAKLRPCVFHNPKWVSAWLLQIAALFSPLRKLGYALVLFLFKKPKEYVDALHGYTFFEDGNSNLTAVGRALGLPMGIHQHTFIIPYDPASPFDEKTPDGSTRTFADFLQRAKDLFEEEVVSTSLIDVLYLPEDVGNFDLSASEQLPGLAVTFTFENPLSVAFTKEKRVLHLLAGICVKDYGGRVSLVKNVDADDAQVATMYKSGIDRMKTKRAYNEIEGWISNEFMGRVLPGLKPPSRTREGEGRQ